MLRRSGRQVDRNELELNAVDATRIGLIGKLNDSISSESVARRA